MTNWPASAGRRGTVVARYDLNRVCLPAHLKLPGVPAKKAAAK